MGKKKTGMSIMKKIMIAMAAGILTGIVALFIRESGNNCTTGTIIP